MKSLSNITILKLLNDMGCGFDIVSGGELYRVLSIGADPKKIIFSGYICSSVPSMGVCPWARRVGIARNRVTSQMFTITICVFCTVL